MPKQFAKKQKPMSKSTVFTYDTPMGCFSHIRSGWLTDAEMAHEAKSINDICVASWNRPAHRIHAHHVGGKSQSTPIVLQG